MKKLLGVIPAAGLLYVLCLSSNVTLTSCTKESDTTIIRDTVIIKDTVVVKDTTCRLYKGLVAYYNFNGGSLKDSSGFDNNITFNNATVTADRFGRPGNAFLFNGSNSYMSVTNNSTLNPGKITMMAIVKANDFYNGYCHGNDILSKGYPDRVNGMYYLRIKDVNPCGTPLDTTKQHAYGGYGDNQSPPYAIGGGSDTVRVHAGRWYTLIYTYDGTTSKFYLNGKLTGTETRTVSFNPNTMPLFIGRNGSDQYPYWFNGVIDEVRIYNRAINENEVKQLSEWKN
jgi:hypothetical protein